LISVSENHYVLTFAEIFACDLTLTHRGNDFTTIVGEPKHDRLTYRRTEIALAVSGAREQAPADRAVALVEVLPTDDSAFSALNPLTSKHSDL
jgi:hypothetical protein